MSFQTMKSSIIAIVAVIVACTILSRACGQTADEPWRNDDTEPRVMLAEVIPDSLQELLDGPQQIIDCKDPVTGINKVFHCTTALMMSVEHHGKHLKNCDVYFDGTNPGNIVAWWLFVQNKTVNGKWYYPGKIDFTLENVRIFGPFIPPTGNQEINEILADRAGKAFNIISNYTYSMGVLKLINVEINNAGNSAIAISAEGFDIDGLVVNDATKHGLGMRGGGGTWVKGNKILLNRCGGSIDFHNEGNFFDLEHPDIAVINELTIRNPRGRNKAAGPNWELTLRKTVIEKDSPVSPNSWNAFDCARRPRKLDVDGLVIKNFAQMGFRFGQDLWLTNASSPLSIKNAIIDTSMYPFMLQQAGARLENVLMNGYRNQWVSGSPAWAMNVVATNKKTDLFWAQTFDACEEQIQALNAEHGTNVQLLYTVPGPIATLMKHK